MNKILLTISSFAVAALPFGAMAANITHVEFENGDVTISDEGGSTVNAELRIVVPANEVVEYVRTDVLGDNLAPVDHSVGGSLGLQEGTHFVDVDVKMPPNTGTYDLKVKSAGIFGGIRSINRNDNTNGNKTFNNALRVISTSNSGSNGFGGDDDDSALSFLRELVADLRAQIAELTAQITGTGGTGTPAPSNLCSQIPYGNTPALQVFLMNNGQAAGFSAVGVYQHNPTNFFGPVTQNALSSFKSVNNCM
jgi:hypothetical protein